MAAGVNGVYLLSQWFLLALFVAEAAAKICLNKDHQLGIVRDHDRYNEISQNQRGTALAVASLVFAGLAIVLSNNPGEFISQIEVFAVAFGLLLIAAFAHEFALTYRIILTLQEMALEYGLMFMVYGLFLLVSELVPAANPVMLLVFGSVILFRFASVYGELKAHYNE